MNKVLYIISMMLFCYCNIECKALTKDEEQKVITTINNTSKKIESLNGSFTQTKYLSLLNDKMVSEGKIYYSRPDKLRWEYLSPYQYLFIFNGSKVYVGNKSKKDIIDTNTNKLFKEIARIMMSTVTGTALSNSDDFIIKVDDNKNCWKVTLTPKKKELKAMFNKVVLSFSKGNEEIQEIDIIEKNNDKTNIRFNKLETNKKVDASLFNIPK